MVSFAVKKLLSLIRCHLFIFVFISITLRRWIKKKKITAIYARDLLLMSSSRSFTVSDLT